VDDDREMLLAGDRQLSDKGLLLLVLIFGLEKI
jgi:hypothetical protein